MRKIIVSFVLTFILMMGINVYASGVVYYLSNSEMSYFYYDKNNAKTYTVKRGDYIYVTAVLDNDGTSYTLKSGKITLRWDEAALSLVNDNGYYKLVDYSTVTMTGSPTITSNKISFNYTLNESLLSNKSKLFQFKFKILDNAPMGTYRIFQMDGEDSLSCIDNSNTSSVCANSYYTEIRYKVEGSSNNYLKDIRIDNRTISSFSRTTETYTIETEKDKVVIAAFKEDNNATISGDIGEKTLKYGVNSFNITVTSESGGSRTYTLYIKRIDKRSKINTLKTLIISDVKINFTPDVLTYDYTVKNDIKKVTVKATLTDSKSRMSEDYSNKEIALSEGVNKISIKVIAENGDEKVYVVNITRELSSNNTLKEIEINKKVIQVKDSVFNYELEVESDIETISVNATPNDKNSLIKVEKNNKLEVGDNDVRIIVTAPDGSEVAYHVTVTRKRNLSSNSNLKELKIAGYNLSFKPDKYYYDLAIGDEESLQIETVSEDALATIDIEGNSNLINGSIIKINVQAEDGTKTRYFINIEKNARDYLPLVIVLCMVFIVMITVLIIVALKHKKDDNRFDDAFDDYETNNSKTSTKPVRNVVKEVKPASKEEVEEEKVEEPKEETETSSKKTKKEEKETEVNEEEEPKEENKSKK